MDRADRVSSRLRERELDALLITDPANLRYATGFTGSNGLAVVGPDVRPFLTDFRYVEQAAQQITGFERERGAQDLVGSLAKGWPDGGTRLGFDDANVSVRRHVRLREALPGTVELVPASGIVEAERAVKDAEEVERIAAATALT